MNAQSLRPMKQHPRQRAARRKPPAARIKYAMLEALSELGDAEPAVLAESLNVPVQSVRKVSQRLIVSGLVRLSGDAVDDRLVITPNGKLVAESARKERRKRLERNSGATAAMDKEPSRRNPAP
ncbi:hypothetical protein ACFPVX_21950 [Cohnella faecalis]|uniref:MarR family transcriptional regulator n=1 Tax=Cohnella faecalis TaxID=2315694 RepID=A0A398CHS3_9BACL|nr:hypothetical protein [Cohnella faecalis]RIE00428.1 hypothetical protein D3H35_28890 [Cohnella faecalis]